MPRPKGRLRTATPQRLVNQAVALLSVQALKHSTVQTLECLNARTFVSPQWGRSYVAVRSLPVGRRIYPRAGLAVEARDYPITRLFC